MGKLTTAKIRELTKAGLHGDGQTLFLSIARGGSKHWIQRVVIHGRRHDLGLGGWPVVSLEKARRRAFENRVAIADGRNPLAERQKPSIPTFKDAALKTYEAMRPRWRNEKVSKNWMQQLERHAFKRLGDLRVDKIGREDILAVLVPLWSSRPETGRRIRRNIKATLSWCQANGFLEHNLAADAIDGALPRLAKVKEHFRALPYAEVSTALDTIEKSRASLSARLCLRFLILTAVRSGEARLATWDEINFESKTWTIPAARMKANSEHRVPLTRDAMKMLEQAKALKDDSNLIFPSPKKPNSPLSDMSLTKVLRDVGLANTATVHGFRSSFRDWAADTGKPREIAEAALAHIVGGVEGAYFRSDLFARRRQLMESWARYLTGSAGRVVRLHG